MPKTTLMKRCCLLSLLALLPASPCLQAAPAAGDPVRGADEPFWVPTLGQALAMARVTGKPIFLMGYSLVGDGSTYTKAGPDFCSGVF